VFICVPHRGSDLAINWIGSFGIALISLPGKLLNGAADVVTAPLQRDVGLKHIGHQRPFPAIPCASWARHAADRCALPLHRRRPWQGRYAEQFGRRSSLLELAPYGRPVGVNCPRSTRFLCSSSDCQRVETHPSLEFGRCQCTAPEHNVKKQRAARSLIFTRQKS
jgi:hypothetical protein